MKTMESVFLLILGCVVVIAASMVGYKANFMDALIGMSLIAVVGLVGYFLARVPGFNKLPSIVWISVVAVFASSNAFPWGAEIAMLTRKVPFMAICTPVLAYAGLSIGKDFDAFGKLSWRIIPVALTVIAGTFICAVIIAQWALHMEGAI